MIRSFADKETDASGTAVAAASCRPTFRTAPSISLQMLKPPRALDDLRSPPSNRLHELSGDRAGQHSISINMQWRICFIWKDGAAESVEIVDYH